MLRWNGSKDPTKSEPESGSNPGPDLDPEHLPICVGGLNKHKVFGRKLLLYHINFNILFLCIMPLLLSPPPIPCPQHAKLVPEKIINFCRFSCQEPGRKHLSTLRESTQAWLIDHKIKVCRIKR
jgi:hypothetical protein